MSVAVCQSLRLRDLLQSVHLLAVLSSLQRSRPQNQCSCKCQNGGPAPERKQHESHWQSLVSLQILPVCVECCSYVSAGIWLHRSPWSCMCAASLTLRCSKSGICLVPTASYAPNAIQVVRKAIPTEYYGHWAQFRDQAEHAIARWQAFKRTAGKSKQVAVKIWASCV